LEARHHGPLPVSSLHRIYREIISASLSLEKKLSVVYLGPEATFTHQAALKQFGHAFNLFSGRTIDDVFHEVEVGRADYGVVPVENSTEGMVFHTLDCFVDSPLKICAEVILPVVHMLLSKVERLEEITVVYSHFRAATQCRTWMNQHLPGIKVVETESTAEAARLACEDPTGAAIAGVYAADHYGLHVLAEHIQDDAGRENRFFSDR
ncbi:prephenate dehydratase domain-containing protein, partial [Magnetococcales bacterium HHB-1]